MKRMIIGCISSCKRPIAQDSFDRANGALGTADLGGSWVANANTFAIVSNKAKATASGVTSIATLSTGDTDSDVACDVTWYTGDTSGIVARCDSSGSANFMRLRYDGTNITITKTVASTLTVLATYAYSWTSGDTHRLRLSCSGNTFTAYIDSVQVLDATDDNATKTKTNAGLIAAKTGAVPATLFDNLLVMG